MIQSIKKSKVVALLYLLFTYIKYYPNLILNYVFFKQLADSRFIIDWSDRYICHEDKTLKTGFDFHYVFHTSWAARTLARINPRKHIDISSSIYFNSIVSAFIPIDFYDYRPAILPLSDLTSKSADLMNLPFKTNSIPSISCMHVIEHVGLGRYGDPIDPQGDIKAINELKRVVKPGGSLLFVTPLGSKAKIQFNAHRIYTKIMILEYFKEFKLKEFVYISEHHPEKGLQTNPSKHDLTNDSYSTACFWFIKKISS